MAAKKTREQLGKSIKKDLLAQLDKGAGQYYLDLVSDYMELWNTKCLLQDDIQCYGIRIKYVNSRGETAEKKNDSVDQLLKTNTQMLKILQELGIKPKLKPAGEEDAL